MRVYSIFDSIDGEVNTWGQGHLTTFIRLSGCSLRCAYCDTIYAQRAASGSEMSVKDIMHKVMNSKPFKVTITGGEPLEQREELKELVRSLWGEHVFATIETNGAHPIPVLPCAWVADYKLPSSGMESHMHLEYFKGLNPDSWIKFVISNNVDYQKAVEIASKLREKKCWAKLAFSPMMPGLPPAELLSWMQKDKLNSITLNIQLHKLIRLSEDAPTN